MTLKDVIRSLVMMSLLFASYVYVIRVSSGEWMSASALIGSSSKCERKTKRFQRKLPATAADFDAFPRRATISSH